ncbi:hypothetical protein XELAEV_18041836mg [Xenopus laevis]|uniref:Uncharacterized protein n=1 Tax=Xenopus laevis TaxID=8355 RepID=A0A974H5H1_XENLA|nr:hypothetical protein XELAEV_18041836mg [Xenopus laevis]
MARCPTLEDSTAAILSLVSMLLDSAESERCVDVPEPTMEPLPCATTRLEPERQYAYQGTFTPSERGMMIPTCGVCDMEAPNALEDPDGVCSQCEARLWMGPFNRADQPPLVEKTRDKVPEPVLEPAFVPVPKAVLEGSPSESTLTLACASPTEEVPLEGDVPVTAAAVSETTPSGWTADVCSTTPSLKPEGLCDILAAMMPTPLVVPTPVSDALGGEVYTPSAIGAPFVVSLHQNRYQRTVWKGSEGEYFPHVLISGTENLLADSQVSSTPMVVTGAAASQVRSNSSEPESASRKVLLSDSKPSPSIHDPPILEDDEDLLEKLMSSSVNSVAESILEVPAQIRCQSKRSVVSEPTKSVCPKVMVPQTPSEPGESTQVAELYHYEWGKISLEKEKDLLATIPKPKEDNPLGPVPGWEEYEENTPTAEPEWDPSTEVPRSFIAPAIIGPEEEKDFWVLPGRADPNVFTSVSRVQRVINFHVHRTWGYFMPYAPLRVYEKVAASYENWLIDEILRKEKMHHSCLTNPDKVRREQDWQYLRSIEKEWWYGRTILKNAVKSCGKYKPTKYFNLEVYLGDGQWVDKPHPKYYIPYEDTKARFLHMI